jgi:hypothetical protein
MDALIEEGARFSARELATRFPGEWLLLVDFEARDVTELASGAVAAHHPSRQVVERTLRAQGPGRYALWRAGDDRPLQYVRVV